jgi:UV DNA damage endonuclease
MKNMNKIGYCCIPLGCNQNKPKKEHILVNRGMIKKTFMSKGLPYVSELILLNLKDTIKVLDYNIENNILVYRLSSDSFPWMSEYNFSDLPNYNLIKNLLKEIGDKAKSVNMRLSYHPGPFNVLASENQSVIDKTISELNKHAELMDMIGLEQSHYYPINIHIGTTKPTLEDAAKKFCVNFHKLSDSCKRRLTIENDDSPNQFSVKMLYDWLYKEINIPIVVDSLHYQCHSDNMKWEDTLRLGSSTWGEVIPMVHHSSSKKLNEDSKSRLTAHADFLYEKFENFDIEVDIELECKKKDIALLKYRRDFLK